MVCACFFGIFPVTLPQNIDYSNENKMIYLAIYITSVILFFFVFLTVENVLVMRKYKRLNSDLPFDEWLERGNDGIDYGVIVFLSIFWIAPVSVFIVWLIEESIKNMLLKLKSFSKYIAKKISGIK